MSKAREPQGADQPPPGRGGPARRTYEPPRVLDLGELAVGAFACAGGPGDSNPGACGGGNGADLSCGGGNRVGGMCRNGGHG